MQKVHPSLTFEFSPKGSIREFVISAGGIKSGFPAVIGLAQAAPSLARWQFTAFRPRRWPIMVVEIEGHRIDPKDVQFSLLDNGKMVGLYLFIPGFQESNVNMKQIGYLLLDEALGEYDVETRVGLIKMLSPDTSTQEDRFPLPELPPSSIGWCLDLRGGLGRHLSWPTGAGVKSGFCNNNDAKAGIDGATHLRC